MQVTIHAAKTHLSKLIAAARRGEEVVIAKGRTPVAKLVPIPEQTFRIGLLKNELPGPGPNFFEPLDEDELALWEGGR